MSKVTRIDPNGRSAERVLRAALDAVPDQVMICYEKDDRIYTSANSGKDRLWRIGALAAALIEEWVAD